MSKECHGLCVNCMGGFDREVQQKLCRERLYHLLYQQHNYNVHYRLLSGKDDLAKTAFAPQL